MKKQLAAVVGCITVLTGTGIQLPAAAQTLTAETLDYYTAWKEAYLRKNPYITDEDQYYVFYGEQTYEQAQETVPVTVSEAHGYGMLIAAMMSGYDPDAKDIFDGMYRYYLAQHRPAPDGMAAERQRKSIDRHGRHRLRYGRRPRHCLLAAAGGFALGQRRYNQLSSGGKADDCRHHGV